MVTCNVILSYCYGYEFKTVVNDNSQKKFQLTLKITFLVLKALITIEEKRKIFRVVHFFHIPFR